MHLYLKLNGTLAEAADLIASAALPTYERQLRDGLNLGGGDYFKFSDATSEVLLVCNDSEHMEVFVEERANFPFYCYVWRGDKGKLGAMLASLQGAGIECEIGDEDD